MARRADGSRFKAIFDSSFDAILLTAPDGRILAANRAAQELFGRSEAEIVAGGRPVLVDTTDPRLPALLAERERTGRAHGELRALRRDGTMFEIELSSVIFVDEAGELRTSMVVRDVTERAEALRLLRESETRFRALAGATFEGVVLHRGGVIVDVNPATCELFGYSDRELRGMRVRDLVAPEEADGIERLVAEAPEAAYEATGVKADGSRFALEVASRDITVGGEPARVAAVRDITVRARQRQALEEQNRRLRELDTLKSEFVALVSHELRTPLTSIVGHLDVLEAGELGELSGPQLRYVRNAQGAAQRLQRLVDDLTLSAHVTSPAFTLAPSRFDLAELAEQVVERAGPDARARGIALRLRAVQRPAVEADRDRIAQLLENLVANALKFTPRGGAAEIGVDVAGASALLSVTDTGPGIPPDELARVFERFYRGRAAVSGSAAGTGLGLPIAREIAEAHGGSLHAENVPAGGSRLVAELPVAS